MCLIVAIQTSPKGIVNKLAPTLSGVQWIDLAQNNAPEITKGEVTYLFFFNRGVRDVTVMDSQHSRN